MNGLSRFVERGKVFECKYFQYLTVGTYYRLVTETQLKLVCVAITTMKITIERNKVDITIKKRNFKVFFGLEVEQDELAKFF